MKKNKNILIYVILGLLIISNIYLLYDKFSQNNIKNFYDENVETLISPHHLREEISNGNSHKYIIVDTREKKDYLNGHIIGSINIIPNENLIENFKKLNPKKEIIIYCYTHYCMRGKKIGKELAKNKIFVKELGIGFNEWENFYKLWNYKSEWDKINISNYIKVGNESGIYISSDLEIGSCSGGDEKYSC